MFDFIYYAVSFILWCWHQVFGFLLGPSNFFAWTLSIILLVFTLRLVLLKPAVHQIRSMRKMQKFAPEMKKIQKKYANDRQRQAAEMQKLQKEHGVNPLGGCLPLVLQIPVFLGLNHVLRSFRPGTTEVYFFKAADVHSYLDAKLFDAHLGDAVLGVGSLGGTPGWHWGVAPVAIPLMIAASIATHFTARLSVQRQAAMGTPATGQTAMMNKLTLYLFPLGVLVFGGGFPVGLLLYWLSNNGWTLAQQHFVFRKMDREEEVQKEEAIQTRSALAPRVGQKPVKRRNATAGAVEDAVPDMVDADVVEDAIPVEDAKPKRNGKPARAGNDPRRAVKPTVPNPNAKKPAPGVKPAPGAKPAPGVRPNTRNGAAAKNTNRANGAAKQDGTSPQSTNGKTGPASEIPGLISDRSRRKKQNRKRG
ncbi:MAG TPA: membrane protein insertase YidC [Pseudonocardiaceae bacterium]|nr:membrane protein insertase YidC [Pseudonocardiaceae bacterium]